MAPLKNEISMRHQKRIHSIYVFLHIISGMHSATSINGACAFSNTNGNDSTHQLRHLSTLIVVINLAILMVRVVRCN
jgi:lysylphosphatidylglycerol synthetase-like protein (DUF2156 family)